MDASVDPMIAQMALARAEALKNQMAPVRGSNCHFGELGTPAEVTQKLIGVLILPNQPTGARVTGMQPNAAMLALYKAGLMPAMAGFFSRYDAQVVDLAYDGPNGPMVERLWLSWTQYGVDPNTPALPGFPSMQFQTLEIVDTHCRLVYAPAKQTGGCPPARRRSSANPISAWLEEVRKVQPSRQATPAYPEKTEMTRPTGITRPCETICDR